MTEQLSLLSTPSRERILYFDLETLRSAGEVGGWGNISKMGMSCGVVYDSLDQKYHVYEEKDVEKLIEHLFKADLVVGFNQVGFDYEVLRGYSKAQFQRLKSFDMLLDVTQRLGHRLKLDSLVSATLGTKKSADGLQSLEWVKQGRLDLVKEYCTQDVKVTKDLFLFGCENKYVYYSSSGTKNQIQVDWKIP